MIKECLQFLIEPAKNLKIHLKEPRRRTRWERQEPLSESQLFIMELARELTWICQKSDVLVHIWTGEDIWPPAMCRQFIKETASILQLMENTEVSLLTLTDLHVMNQDCGERLVCVTDDEGNDLGGPKRSIMDWSRRQRRRHPHGVWPGDSVLTVLGDVEMGWRKGHLPHLQPALELLIWVALLTHLDKELIPRLWLAQKLKSICEVTFDPDTAHSALLVSDDGKRMRCCVDSRPIPLSRCRFDGWMCVVATEGFTAGRHYWEVEVGERDWRLGVAKESARRNGFGSLDSGSGYLTLRLERGTRLTALTLPVTRLACSHLPHHVGLYLDYEQGQLSFYDTQRRAHIYTYCGTFTERLFPVFGTADIMRDMVIRPAALRWSCLCDGPCLF
uniref:B30.2/SPRY domain-containing protein n=1 Tax=Electrophorus electricus TaxID=8005 RepID=A0A4W4GFW5_ELEEL